MFAFFLSFLVRELAAEYSSHQRLRLTTLVDHPSRLEKTGESHSLTIGNLLDSVKKASQNTQLPPRQPPTTKGSVLHICNTAM